MTDNLVSIITPNYNCEQFISQAIDSVLSQTYQNWEMIIVDDCSIDNSIEVISCYLKKDSRIQLLKTRVCSGSPAEPRNIGIQKARGRYIAFLDSDDIWLPDKLKCQVNIFVNKDTAVVYANFEKITETGIRKDRVIIAPKYVTYKKLLKSNCIQNVTAMYDVSKVGKQFFQSIHHEDYVLWLNILKMGYIATNANITGALYRVRRSSVSGNKFIVLKWQWNIYRSILKLSLSQCVYYFCFYIIKGIIKYAK
ncbi:glycosyl transferase [Spirochaetia bacterium]|nr:glycosyl transferase [Spirochaetia bacterium]